MESDHNTDTNEISASIVSTPQPSAIERMFRNRFGHWRAGWRLTLYLIAVFAIGKAITSALKLFMSSPAEAPFASWTHSVLWLVGACALIAAALILLVLFDHRPGALLGLDFGAGWLRELGIGVATGAAATGLLVVILAATGSVSLAITAQLEANLTAMPRLLFIFTAAATVEELIFRGYPLQVLSEGSRPWLAGTLLCVVFTIGHLGNPDVTAVGIANIFLASVALTVLYFQTRRLWLPIGVHVSWNFTQSWLWGFDVSGIAIENRLFSVANDGPDLLTGGEFGLEGSVLSTVLFLGVVVWLLAKPVVRPTEDVARMWARYPTGFGLEPAQSIASADSVGHAQSIPSPDPGATSNSENRPPPVG